LVNRFRRGAEASHPIICGLDPDREALVAEYRSKHNFDVLHLAAP
jgi:hypothetical protein